MKILVARKGFGKVTAPSDVSRWSSNLQYIATNPEWIKYHKYHKPVIAVNIIDEMLEPGEYDAELTWQYYSDLSNNWFNCEDPREKIAQGLIIRLAFVKQR